MKKGDLVWLFVFFLVSSVMLVPASHAVFVTVTKSHPYMMGFIKFAILATMGELMAIRLIGGSWKKPAGVIPRSVIWGLIGMLIVLMFEIFSAGVGSAIAKGLVWSGKGEFAPYLKAFWTSAIMNCAFAPVFMIGHRITDTYIDMAWGENIPLGSIRFPDVIARIDWKGFFTFVVGKTIPFFWIPAHTITFITPPEYRVLIAAYLSIALGAILAYAKRWKR